MFFSLVPVVQTLTVLSEGEDELMKQIGGESNNNNSNHHPNGVFTPTTPPIKLEFNNSCSPPYNLSLADLSPQQHQHLSPSNGATSGQKRKVGRPITSAKTMNRYVCVFFLFSPLHVSIPICYASPN